jgi:D-glycero-D-manno-heptose 1,7-bisphosphate phosphatase
MKEQQKKFTIFLDRDGVINEKAPEGDYIKSPEELKLLEGAAEAIKEFNDRGYLVIVITNQRGIGKGIMSENDFEKVMAKLNEELGKRGAHIDAYYYCPDIDDASPCRKPNVGMFLKAKEDFPDIDFRNSFVVGDSWRDVEAGKRLGAKTILIGNNTSIQIKSDYVVDNLLEVVSIIEEYCNENKNG